MRNMSVSCDCEGTAAMPVVTPNAGILSSEDILAVDQACIDIVYAMKPEENHDLVERIESRHGLRQLTYMKELGMGCDRYTMIDLDNGGKKSQLRRLHRILRHISLTVRYRGRDDNEIKQKSFPRKMRLKYDFSTNL